MNKKLFLAALAMVSVIGSYAYEIGEYAYTATQRLKIMGENLVTNGNFANGTEGWYGANGTDAVNSSVWQVTDAMGPNGEAVIESLSATEGEPFCNTWQLSGGQTYVVSFQVKAPAYVNSTVGTTVGNNYADFFLNTTGSIDHYASTEEKPVVNVATSFAMDTEWKDVAFVFTPEEGHFFVMHFEKLATGTMITNFAVQQVVEVYDDRVALRKIAFAEKILNDPNFHNDNTTEAYDNFYYGVYAYLKDLVGTPGALDDMGEAEALVDQFDAGLAEFMEVSAPDMATEANFKYVTDLTTFPKYNRGNISNGQVIGGFIFRGDNWQHGQGADFIQQAIQGTYNNGPGSAALYSTSLPEGKYYFAVETRVANMDKNFVKSYNLEKAVKLFIGSDSTESITIYGDGWAKLYTVKELKAGETFEAGIWWEGHTAGSAFELKSFECRAFGNVKEEAERKAVWDKFIVQYNAVVSARKTVVELQADANYPWGKDSLARALELWDPYYNNVVAKGWVTEDGRDTRFATNEELADWADYQGVEMYDVEGNLLKFQLVRGYHFAANYVKGQNQIFFDLKDEITKAESIRDDILNQQGDKTTFQAAINAANATRKNILANTTDQTRGSDYHTLFGAIETLKEAEKAFKASVPKLSPIVDINFSNNFEPVYTTIPVEEGEPEQTLTGYVIKGAAGQMEFSPSIVGFDEETKTYSTTGTTFGIGYLSNDELLCPDMLRVGSGEATVNLGAVAEDEVLRVQFDLYVGNLINRAVWIDLRNENNERVAGFSLARYSGTVAYNEFNNEANTGLDILNYVTGVGSAGNDAIADEKNKSSFDLIIDYKSKALKGIVTNGTNGTCEGAWIPLPNLEDTKIVKFVLGSTYDNEARRCWFDSLKIVKLKAPSVYKLDVADLNIKAGESNTQEILLNNDLTNLIAFQMDVTLPDGVGIDKTGCTLSSRVTDENQGLTIGKLESGAYRITSTSFSLTPISGNEGPLLNLKLTAAEGCIGGKTTISNIIFSTAESEKIIMSDKTFDISILYDLTYKVDGQVYKDTTLVYGAAITPEAELAKEGYTFSGWSEIPETMPNHDVEIIGKFTINKYLLTYIVDDEIVKSDSIEFSAAITPLEEPTKEGYTFSGWSEILETMPSHDVVIKGTFAINKYLLTYMVDGEVFKSDSIFYNTALNPEAEPIKEGYTFSGWSEIPETMPAHDVTITGTFTINKYLLTYKVDGEVVKSDSIEFNTTITPIEEPTKEGYTFTGWSEIPETMPSHDVEITGNFYQYGDVNTDEAVDVVDVVDIARFVVATPSVNFREKLADLNFDKTVNIADAVTLVNYIAGDQDFARAMTSKSYDYDQCQLQLLSNGTNALSLCLDGEADFTAFQFEVELPEDMDITAMRINGQRMDNHQLIYNKVGENSYRVVALSLSNAVFKGSEGELLNISIDGLNTNEVSVQNIHFVTKNGTDITFDALSISGTVTGIANVRNNEGDDVIFDLQGRKLSKVQRGVNIVNGKKVIVNK